MSVSSKKNLYYIINFMQALMSIQYYVDSRIYQPKLSGMKIKTFLILNITSTTKKNMLKGVRTNKPTRMQY